MTTILAQIGSMLNLPRFSQDDGAGPSTESSDTPGTLLHECPCCGEIYLSESPKECSSCEKTTVSIGGDE